MSKILIKNASCILPDSIRRRDVLVSDGKIADFPQQFDEKNADQVVDAAGRYLSPGFIDTHTHGAGGCDYMDGTSEAIVTAARMELKHGATTVVPTMLSSSYEEMADTICHYKDAKKNLVNGPHLAGMHMEGPYFSANQCGAQNPKYIRAPDPEEYRKLIELAGGDIILWSLAPELDGAMDMIRYCSNQGIRTSAAHSDAVYEEVCEAYALGCKRITHLYSACSTIVRVNGFRKLGIVESAFTLKDMCVELIADGCHLPPELIRMVYDAKGPDKICLITDSMRAAGTDAETSILGGLKHGVEIVIEDGVAKMPGKLSFAGSIATCDRLVRVACHEARIPLYDAVKMAATTPANSIGIGERTGSIELGKDADLLLFDDDINISWYMVGGEIIAC